jgi:hypothetical protein
MFGSGVLEVAIGLMLVYLLLSLVCSAINEFVGRLLNWRSSTLEVGVKAMLADLKDSQNRIVGDIIYSNPLISRWRLRRRAKYGSNNAPRGH